MLRVSDLIDTGDAEVTTGPFGTQLSASEYVDLGTPIINVRNIGLGDVRSADLEFVNSAKAAELDRHRLQAGDIVFGRKGAVERHALIGPTTDGWIQGSDCIRLRLHSETYRPRFASIAMRTPWHQRWMQNLCSFGAIMHSLNQEIVGLIELPAIGVDTQDRIIDAISPFDDLIENNRWRIEILEEMARLLYREWFVHFRFAGYEDVELVDSSLGPIPKSWGETRLAEACSLVMGQSPKSEYYNDIGEGLPFHQGVSDFGHRFPTHTKWTTVDKRVAEAGDILFSVRAPVGRINVAPDRLVVGRGLSAIRALDEHQNFLLMQLKDKFAVEDSIGGGTIFNAVTRKDMESIVLLRPTSSVVEEFEAVVAPMADLVANFSRQIIALQEARDLLLPRLVSGKLDVSELDLGLEVV